MSDVAITQPVSAQTLEHVLGTGDLSKLTTRQRVEYYGHVCSSLGLNPLTRPFRFLALNGQIQLYATRDATDQLRKVNGITLHIIDKQIEGELFTVTVRARDKHGRDDEDMGVVALGQLRGESRANALMKAVTKAKRRVTLSICGLGLTDEAELDTMPGAVVFDAEDEVPPVRIKTDAEDMRAVARQEQERRQEAKSSPPYQKPTASVWLDALEARLDACESAEELEAIINEEATGKARARLRNGALERLETLLRVAAERLMSVPDWHSDDLFKRDKKDKKDNQDKQEATP